MMVKGRGTRDKMGQKGHRQYETGEKSILKLVFLVPRRVDYDVATFGIAKKKKMQQVETGVGAGIREQRKERELKHKVR